jgi:uncharacterized surface anchored protein
MTRHAKQHPKARLLIEHSGGAKVADNIETESSGYLTVSDLIAGDI